MNFMMMMMQMMQQMIGMFTGRPTQPQPPVGGGLPNGGAAPLPGGNPAGLPNGGMAPLPGGYPGPQPLPSPYMGAPGAAGGAGGVAGGAGGAGGVGGVAGGAGGVAGGAGGVAGGAGGAAKAVGAGTAQLSLDDYKQYIMGQSFGGTKAAGTDDIIRYTMDQNSKLYKTGMSGGANEVDAVIAKSYADQFKGYALGLNVAYKPGDNMNQIAANIAKGGQAKMTQEAETLANVAALYRGELSTGGNGTGGAYDNKALQKLLVSWGRQDIAGQAGVGDGDIQSVGGVVRALNEEKDVATRQKWLNQIFDFQNNSPNSPSGAVPQQGLKNYQNAISLYQNGTYAKLLDNYNKGINTSGSVLDAGGSVGGGYGSGGPGGTPGGPGGTPGGGTTKSPDTGGTLGTPDTNKNIDFTQLNDAQRSELGLNNRDRAILHLWGRQVITKGFQDGSIYNNVLSGNWQDQDEVALVKELQAKEMQEFGGVTGKGLDREFFNLMQRINPGKLSDAKEQQYLNAPVRFSNGQPLDIVSDVNTLQQRTGLSGEEQAALRLWGHEPLFNGGKIDGSILAYTIGNNNALDSNNKGGAGAGIDNFARSLLNADFASDGVRNGDSLEFAFGQVLDKLYLGGDGIQANEIANNAKQVGQANGRTAQQMQQDSEKGMVQAMADSAKFVKDHPIVSAAAIGGMAAATAICPFLGAMGAGAAGIMAGQNMMKK